MPSFLWRVFFLTTGKNSVYLYENWRRKYAAPFTARFSAKNITEFFEELVSRPNWETDFFKACLERSDEDEVFSFDATNIATEALQIEDVRDGKGKKSGIRRQVNMALAFGHKCGLPVLFRVFPGNILDVGMIPELLFRFKHFGGVRVLATVPDRGHFSKDNLVRFLRGGYNCLMAAKTNVSWVADAIEEALPGLGSHLCRLSNSVQGKTVPVDLKLGPTDSRRVWVHVFRDRRRAISEEAELFEDLAAFEEKWTNCNDDVIARALERTVLFASVSTMECSTRFALDTYGQRDSVEKCFVAGKTNFNMDVLRAHGTHTMEGRFIVSFVALTLLCELKRRMAAPESAVVKGGIRQSLADEFTWNSLMSFLSPSK